MKELYETAELDITLFACDDLLTNGSQPDDVEKDTNGFDDSQSSY
jgi:hypothetical protein